MKFNITENRLALNESSAGWKAIQFNSIQVYLFSSHYKQYNAIIYKYIYNDIFKRCGCHQERKACTRTPAHKVTHTHNIK